MKERSAAGQGFAEQAPILDSRRMREKRQDGKQL
jgi:hypothetical protein